MPDSEAEYARQHPDAYSQTPCRFFSPSKVAQPLAFGPPTPLGIDPSDETRFMDLRGWVEKTPLTMDYRTPIELVVQLFQRFVGLPSLLIDPTDHPLRAYVIFC